MELERFEWPGYKNKKTFDIEKIKKHSKKIIYAVILLAIVFLIFYLVKDSDFNMEFSNPFIKEEIPAKIEHSEISISPARKISERKFIMTIGEESTIRFSYILDGASHVSSSLEIPAGVDVLSGNMQNNQTVKANATNILDAYVRAVRVGRWEGSALVISGNETHRDAFILCIDVLEDKALERCS